MSVAWRESASLGLRVINLSVSRPSSANLISLRAAMSMPQRPSSMVIIAVQCSGRLMSFLSMSVLTFHAAMLRRWMCFVSFRCLQPHTSGLAKRGFSGEESEVGYD